MFMKSNHTRCSESGFLSAFLSGLLCELLFDSFLWVECAADGWLLFVYFYVERHCFPLGVLTKTSAMIDYMNSILLRFGGWASVLTSLEM